MLTKCITVYTSDYEVFGSIYEEIIAMELEENEEVEIEGITVSDSGEVSMEYIDKMKQKPEVAVLKIRERNILIMQHGDVFEILIPA